MTFTPPVRLVRLLAVVTALFSVYYLAWRALATMNPHALWLSALLLGAECYGLATFLLHIFLTWDTRSLERRLGLRTGQPMEEATVPSPPEASVDVFIPTYNESVSLLRRTALAAREISGEHRTWVLDDGRRDEVREMCEELGVGYLSRGDNAHAKAGNINAALARTEGDLILVLDADFIALPQLLDRTLGHFRDERLAFVQLPQAFYNVDSVQHVDGDVRSGWHEQTLFYDVIQPGKNRWNSAFWCGSPALVRRAALESVGGAATHTVTEDILTSMRLHAAGWRSLYHNEILAVGVAPGDLDSFGTQRLRWAQGSMQILRSRENPLWKRGLTLPQRINYLASMTTYFQAVQLGVLMAIPMLVLVSDQSPIAHLGPSFFLRFAPYLLLTVLASKLMGQNRQRFLWDQYYSFLRLFTFLRAVPILIVGGKRLRFRVTPKSASGRRHRSGLYPHLAVAILNVGVCVGLVATPIDRNLSIGTIISVAICAAAVAGIYLFVVARLWRRIYRRHHYRVEVALPTQVRLAGGTQVAAETCDVSFGGVSMFLTEPIVIGSRAQVRLLDQPSPITLDGTVVSCRVAGERYRAGFAFDTVSGDAERLLLFCVLEAALGRQLPAARPSQRAYAPRAAVPAM